jgi:RimJ/RimL family protein N-acetyltransferase
MTFNTTQHIILENDTVKLTPLIGEDFDKLLPFALNEPTLWEYSLTPGDGEDNLRTYFELALKAKEAGTAYPFLVFDKRTQEYAGTTRFYDIQNGYNTTQLGYTWYGQKFWGTGLNKNCKYLLLDFAFSTWKLDRVEFRADYNNKRSIAAMKSLGCTVEGVLRSNCASPTGRRDSIVLSILKDEWFGGISEDLKNKIINQ